MSQNGEAPVTRAELRAELEQLFTRGIEHVDQRFARVSEHFEQRFTAMSGHVEQRFTAMSEHFEQRFTAMSEHFDERTYDTETKLLRAFREFATAQDVRLRKNGSQPWKP